MLKPMSGKPFSTADFVVADIENTPDGEVIDIDTAWRNQLTNEIEHKLFQDWKEWFKWVKSKARKDPKYRMIYAHNGGGWDWLSLAQRLLTDLKSERETISAVMAGSSMIVLTVKIKGRCTIKFCDSLQLLRSKLDDLSDQFLGDGKVDTGGMLPHELKQTDIIKYYKYVQRDTNSLLQILEKALIIIREKVAPIGNFGATIGSTAMTVFRTIGIEQPITIPWNEELKELLRQGYVGGRVECFKPGIYDAITVYDINSLYPSVMRAYNVPISDRGEWVTQKQPGDVGCYRIRFKQYRRDIPAVFIHRGIGCYEGEGVYYSPEIELLQEIDPHAIIEVDNGFSFFDVGIVFRAFVDRLYQLRLENPDTPLSLLCKFLLNSLYGKFGQHPIREQLVSVEDFEQLYDMVDGGAKVTLINDDLCVYSLEHETTCAFEHVGIAGTITSHARATLYRGLLEANVGLVYCDTDSVHTTGRIPDRLVGKELGLFKKEFEGKGAYAGKKLYGLQRHDGSYKIRAKGVSVGGRNGFALDFNDICSIVNGEQIKCTFQRPATPKQVFAGKQPCRFTDKSRRIKRTA